MALYFYRASKKNVQKTTANFWINLFQRKSAFVEPPALPFHYTVSLVQWVNRLLPATGGSSSRPGDAPTLLELGSPSC
jgi:hypothetical protein